ncbi:MAG: argininosuccinate lyase [Deltaproteobacteria bacterium]|nr:MAG: argininosuccinate lyase [Deltaproteobacteria bacterium]
MSPEVRKQRKPRMNVDKLWGGRFDEMPSEEMVAFLSGRDVRAVPPCDERLIPYDLWGNRAHVIMLCRQGILSREEGKKILSALRDLVRLYQKGQFRLDASKEDVHSNVESFLIEKVGMDYGGKVHTGRSRNDQIALDMRLYLRDQALDYVEALILLVDVLIRRGKENRLTIMPGYTHHQRAMVTTFGHLLLSFAESLYRDRERFIRWFPLFNRNPLGAAAGYGTSFDLDRKLSSRLLGFEGPTENVTDAITQRWEPEAEFAYAVTVMMNHLATIAQTLILLSTREFNMVRLDDRHCSGSSMMPQKRNPDTLEVVKAKSAFAQGALVSLLSVGKSLFMGYNRETQWTKYWILDLIDETKPCLSVMADVVRLLKVNKAAMSEAADREFMGATPFMEWMVRFGGLPLRKAKMVMEKGVKYSEREGKDRVSYEGLRRAMDEMDIDFCVSPEDVEKAQAPQAALSQVRSVGTPSERRVDENIASLRERSRAGRKWMIQQKREVEKAKKLIAGMEAELGI